MKCTVFVLAAFALFVGRVEQASAQVVYSNLPTDINQAGVDVSTATGSAQTDTFSLGSSSTITAIVLDLGWLATSGTSLASITVGITDTGGGVELAPTIVTSILQNPNGPEIVGTFNELVYVDVPQLPVSATLGGSPPDLILTVSKATLTGGTGPVYWELGDSTTVTTGGTEITNSTIGTAKANSYGFSYALLGSANSDALSGTPEPGSFAMMGMAAFSFAGYFGMRRRKHAATA
jgi:hypothetical protein